MAFFPRLYCPLVSWPRMLVFLREPNFVQCHKESMSYSFGRPSGQHKTHSKTGSCTVFLKLATGEEINSVLEVRKLRSDRLKNLPMVSVGGCRHESIMNSIINLYLGISEKIRIYSDAKIQ